MTYLDINDIAGCMYYDKSLIEFLQTDTMSRYNAAKEQDVRYRPFNLPALIERALNAKREPVDGLTCVKILKLLEGDHNKVLLFTMSDGDELIARLPNPNAGSNRFTVASEVATRRFLQNICNIPSPRVWDWDFRDRNPVGAEWIIESKAAGEPLHKHWFGMDRRAQLGIIEQVVDLETKLTSQDPSEYMELIFKYAALQQQLIRPEFDNDPCTLSHPNLSLDNIWIDPSTEKIVSLTGWQSITITPPLLKRPYPKFLDTEFQTQSDDRSLPLPKERYRELVKSSDPLRYDRIFSNPQKYELLMGPMSNIFNAWNNCGIFALRESLLAFRNSQEIDLAKSVPELDQFSSEELESHAREKYARQELDVLFNMIQNVQHTVNIPRDGRVLTEDFEHAKELSEVYRRQYIDLAGATKSRKAMHEKTWPFDSSDDEVAAAVSRNQLNRLGLVKKHHSKSKLNGFRKIYVD
ncbi:hypothetical protein EIK77_005507 [Talaromyces pinophilus]|nr:hypothetical protein EIK77_005507 [Talaromyces pinophilus]